MANLHVVAHELAVTQGLRQRARRFAHAHGHGTGVFDFLERVARLGDGGGGSEHSGQGQQGFLYGYSFEGCCKREREGEKHYEKQKQVEVGVQMASGTKSVGYFQKSFNR